MQQINLKSKVTKTFILELILFHLVLMHNLILHSVLLALLMPFYGMQCHVGFLQAL